MTKDYPGEVWKAVKFEVKFANDYRIEVSNFGRLRTFNKINQGQLLNGSMVNGYKIIRTRLFRERDQKSQQKLDASKKQVDRLYKNLKALKENKENKAGILEATNAWEAARKSHAKKMAADLKERCVYYQSLIHRLVANCFLKPPHPDQTIVGHLDHNKLNNRSYNLKWMTPEENYLHQRNSPAVIQEKEDRKSKVREGSTTKLTVTKVMLLKKLLNQNKPIKQLAKQFKVTETQIIRIKKGENWGDIDAAP